MPDMLVKLYQLPDPASLYREIAQQGIIIKRALAPELSCVTDFVEKHFSKAWASEAACAFANQPVSCYIAIDRGAIVGFACAESTCKAFFGPTGVLESHRGRRIGKALLLRALEHLRDIGYAYAIIGAAGPVDFYAGACGATVIEGSVPGIYANMQT